MPITSISLYRDTKKFFRNELVSIIIMILLMSFITVILGRILTPDVHKILFSTKLDLKSPLLSIMKDLPLEQQTILIRSSVASNIALLIGNSLFLEGMIYLISSRSKNNKINILQIIQDCIFQLPKLALQIFLIILLVQFGFIMLIVPGIILFILLSLSPIFLINEKLSVIKAMQASMYLAWNNIKIITPAILIWLITKIFLIELFSPFNILYLNTFFFSMLLHILGNFISTLLIIYLYRLYILSSH